nr:uncharacterized protein LOC109189286 [Ipomoea trifida]
MSEAMAGVGEEGVDYESDPEEAKLSLKMRRREASDDEEETGGEREKQERREKPPRRIDSDGELEEQGGVAEYDEEEGEESEYDEEYEEYVDEEEEEYDEGRAAVGEEEGVGEHPTEATVAEGSSEVIEEGLTAEGTGLNEGVDGDNDGNLQRELEEKKENEPYAVPTAGAFYMHDDRFRDNARGRQRRTFGGRKLWESRDDRKWGHDKFEELTMEERHYDGGRRTSRGRYRGRGKMRGSDPGYPRGRRPRAYGNENNQNNENKAYANNQKIQNNAPRGVRGRGPRRYRPSFKDNDDAPPPQNRRFGKSVEKPSHSSSGKASGPVANVDSDPLPTSKQGFVSSLNSASPPFYPSSASTKEMNVAHERDLQSGSNSRNVQSSLVKENSSAAQPGAMLRGKNVIDSVAMDKLNIDDSVSSNAGKPSTTMQLTHGSSFSTQSQPLRAQGRGITTFPQMNFQPTGPNSQVNKVSHPTQRNSVQSRGQPSLQATGQHFIQRSGTGSQASSPPKTGQSINVVEPGELELPSESSKLKSAVIAKGKGSMPGSGRGSIVYGGAQVMGTPGSTGSGHGDQNFSATPAFLPVMQFGNQHPGGIGVPAVGMAFPGYVAQPQLGLGSSEMTWLPVLAGAAGALGATYCSPYIAVDGAYHGRPSGQISTLTAASSKENNSSKPNNEGKPSQKPELGNDDFGQRQKNPRRYTEMKFDQ